MFDKLLNEMREQAGLKPLEEGISKGVLELARALVPALEKVGAGMWIGGTREGPQAFIDRRTEQVTISFDFEDVGKGRQAVASALKSVRPDKVSISGTMGIQKGDAVAVATEEHGGGRPKAWDVGKGNVKWTVSVMGRDRMDQLYPGLKGRVYEAAGSKEDNRVQVVRELAKILNRSGKIKGKVNVDRSLGYQIDFQMLPDFDKKKGLFYLESQVQRLVPGLKRIRHGGGNKGDSWYYEAPGWEDDFVINWRPGYHGSGTLWSIAADD